MSRSTEYSEEVPRKFVIWSHPNFPESCLLSDFAIL